jgi:NAD dependent epimerase/dehydratase
VAWTNRRVLVTGAGGFIGSHLVERLTDLGASTRALVRYTSAGAWGWLDTSPVKSSVEVFAGDICDRDVLRRAMQGVDVVFHLAALIGIPYSYDAPASYVRTNIDGTIAVLQTAMHAGVRRIVHTSTSEVYGTARTVPIGEDHPLQAQSPYAASKASADLMARSFHLSFGVDVVTVRPFNTYGPRQSARAVIPSIITQALSGTAIKLGSLSPTRDFTYVFDTVDAFIRAADAEGVSGLAMNLGTGSEISIGELARMIQTIAGTNLPVVDDAVRVRPAASEVERLCADASRARTAIGWKPQTSLADGLAQTIAWMRQHLERYRVGKYSV